MAIANIATLMARDYQKKVLIVDWDLESPGLHRFFNLEDSDLKGGVIDIIYNYKKLLLSDKEISEKELPNITQRDGEGSYEYIIPLKAGKGSLFIMPAGRLDEEYAMKINLFDWKNFYDEWEGGQFINNLRQQFRKFADYTLVDSRTGITDIGGICTRQLPDTIILMFASNWQNLDGVKKIAERVRVDFEDNKINLLPVLSRVEPFLEHDKYEFWKNLFRKELGQYIPKNVNKVEYVENISIPYSASFAFDEYPIAVNIESGTDPKQISFTYKYLLKGIMGKEEKVVIPKPFPPDLHNQTPPEPNFVGRREMLKTMTEWYNDPDVSIGALIGWGGVGKSALVRKWYDSLEENKIHPDGIFWWGFYRNASLDRFLNALLSYISQGQIDLDTTKGIWEKTDKIKEYISKGAYLIILDGLEQMQKSESGDEFGKMAHRECTELLHYLADTAGAGLCLVTTRFPVKDLDRWHGRSFRTVPLVDLSVPDALAMLRKRGVKGNDEEMKEVIEKYKGHALSLTSVAGFVKRYHDGDITKAPDVQFVFGVKERFKDVNKLLHKYAEKMSESELVFLNIFSLFRGEVTEKEFAGVFRHKTDGTDFNDVLVKMNELDVKDLVDGLVDWRLVSYDETKKSYSTHPLIKTYFESIFDEKNERLCHKSIYRYFGERAPELPETLEEMQPLFEQVYHGCAAGLYDGVWYGVYWDKISRRNENFIVPKLGGWETDLSLVRNFFPNGEFLQLPLVSRKREQSWLLNSAGLFLLNTGRPKEASNVLRLLAETDTKGDDWAGASATLQNLADLQFRIGEIQKGLQSARRALEMAEKAGSTEDILRGQGYLAYTFHLLGKSKEAEKWFKEADGLERKMNERRLYSIGGVFYADFLLSTERIDEALELTGQNLEFCREYSSINDFSRCHRCLAAIERIRGNQKEAEAHLEKALELARKVGMPGLEIETLLEYSRLYLDKGEYKDAIKAANEVLKLCQRTGFLLYEPDAEVVLARAYLGQKDFDQAKTFANSAHSKAKKMGYKLAENDAAKVLKEIGAKK